jgi:chemotaxis protein MotB
MWGIVGIARNFFRVALAFCCQTGKLEFIVEVGAQDWPLPGLWERSKKLVGMEPAFGNRISKQARRPFMARRFLALGVVGLLLTGCVSRDQYEAVKLERNALAEQLGTAQASSAADRAAADAWKSQQERLIAAGNDQEKMAAALTRENAELAARNRELQGKYETALNNQGQIVMGAALPQEIAGPLDQLARENSASVEFDAARGVLKLKSDVTFNKGSAELTPQAKTIVDRVAGILNTPSARNYEFLVAGHTDNTPVSNPATVAAGHKDNMYLSSHRAISVAKQLVAQHVSPQRIGYIGFGDQRPVASNATTDGQSRNRRVEIMISPTTVRSSPGIAENAAAPNAPRKAAPVNKDTVTGGTVEQRPIITK